MGSPPPGYLQNSGIPTKSVISRPKHKKKSDSIYSGITPRKNELKSVAHSMTSSSPYPVKISVNAKFLKFNNN